MIQTSLFIDATPFDKSKLTTTELCVYELIEAGRITQQEICNSARFIGCHPIHEDFIKDKNPSTLRKIRQVIRDLRLIHGARILSDSNGYWICKSNEEATEYLIRLEGYAKSQAAADFETYRAMKNIFKVESEYFESLK